MHVNVEYSAQLKRAAGTAAESFELPADATLHDLVTRIVERHDDSLRGIFVTNERERHPSILVFVNDQQVRGGDDPQLLDGCTVSFLSPISGG